jgi:4-aminobutyrate aminotransferase
MSGIGNEPLISRSDDMTETQTKSSGIVARDAAVLADSLKVRFFPFAAARAEGSTIYDVDGKKNLDFTAGWAVANIGYGDRRVVDAVHETFSRLSFATLVSMPHEQSAALAERLTALTPGSFAKKVWFGLSGSDANDFLAKMVPLATGRPRFLSFIGGYHGQTAGSAALSGHTAQAKSMGGGNVVKVPYPNPYRPTFGVSPDRIGEATLDFIENYLFKTICPPADTGAVILEAIQSDGGDIVPPPGFLKGLAELCQRHGILLIVDEVKVGMGRSGLMFAFEHEGVVPDAVSLGKSLGGGLPISAVVGRQELLDAATANSMFTTAGNPACCAAALATLDVIESDRLVERAAITGKKLLDALNKLMTNHELIGDVRGRGMIIGVELVRNRTTKEPASLEAAKVVYRAAEPGLLVFYGGVYSNVLEITPPLILTEAEIEQGVAILDQAITDVENGLVSDEQLGDYAGW